MVRIPAFVLRIPDLYFCYLLCQNDVRMTSERMAVVRVPCMIRQTTLICWGRVGGGRTQFDMCIRARYHRFF